MVGAVFDGCSFGLAAGNNCFIKKPWKVFTDMPLLYVSLEGHVCDGLHEHVPCASGNTERTENYTPELVAAIHDAFA